MTTLELIRSANAAASKRYRRTWTETIAGMIRSGCSDLEIETFVRTVRMLDTKED